MRLAFSWAAWARSAAVLAVWVSLSAPSAAQQDMPDPYGDAPKAPPKPEAKKPEVKKPEAKKPETKKVEAQKPKAEAKRPGANEPKQAAAEPAQKAPEPPAATAAEAARSKGQGAGAPAGEEQPAADWGPEPGARSLEPSPTAPSSSTPAPAPAPAPPESKPLSPLALAGFGVGAAFLITGIVAGAVTLEKAADLKNRCAAQCYQSEIDENEPRAHLATASFVIAGLGFAGGIAALLLDRSKAPGESRAAVRPAIGPGSVGIEGRF